MFRPAAFVAAAAVLSTVACSSSSSNAPAPSSGADAAYSFQYVTPAGQETHWCQYVKLPKTDSGDVVVTGYKWNWQGLHHWALYKTTPDLPANVDTTTPFDCFQDGAMKHAQIAALVLAGTAQGEQKFPDGVGFTFKSEETIIVQAHSVNATASDAHLALNVDLELGDPAKTPNRLGLIQFYDPYIYVPAHADARAQMRCKIPQDMTVLFGTTHEHLRGVGVQVFVDGADGKPAASPVLSSTNWDTPNVMNAPLSLGAGSMVRTECSYHGDANDAYQGQDKIDNEMCMFIGYYYPAIADDAQRGFFENCVQTPLPGGVGDSFGTGAATCMDSVTCIQACPPTDAPNPHDGRIDVGKCWQKCLVNACASATAPLNALGYCVQNKCATACGPGGNCASCVLSNCSAEYTACGSATCK